MLNAVQFDARGPVQFALAPRPKSKKPSRNTTASAPKPWTKCDEDEPIELLVGEDKEITECDQEASVIKFVNQIIWEAFKDRATDIHFEPAEDELRIRYRIDGILHQTPMPPQLKRYQAAIISRIKVMSGMNIAEKRLPQDGRINVRIKGRGNRHPRLDRPDRLRRERLPAFADPRQDLSQPGQAGIFARRRRP